MSFDAKIWKDRDVQYPGKRTITNVLDNSDFKDVIVSRAEGNIETGKEGDLFCASVMNDLETRIYNAFEDVLTALSEEVNTVYPVGAIYQSFSNVSPATYFPGTTWEPIIDKLLLPVATSDTSPENRGNAGHSVTINALANKQTSVSGVIGGTSLNESQMPPHTHQYARTENKGIGGGTWDTYIGTTAYVYATGYTDKKGRSYAHSHNLSASGSFAENPITVNIDQPYITMYCWKRTS